ncbi:MAG: metal ABC transporter permease [Planctomycetia bacterium]|jgi:zinc transport system permease protein
MVEFWDALRDVDIPFLRYALIAGLLACVSFGVVGTYVVTRRISYLAGAIAHSVLGGIGVAVYAQEVLGWKWCHPMLGALLAAILAAVLLGLISLYAKEREDTAISVIWAMGMSIGLIFFYLVPNYTDPMTYLFGNILFVDQTDIWAVLILDIVVVILTLLFHERILAVAFDEEFARLRGLRTGWYFMLLLIMTALSVVLLVRLVGIVMVIALLTIPAAIAGRFVGKVWQIMIVATVLSMLFISSGLYTAYQFELVNGPMIILIAGTAYLISLLLCWCCKGICGKRDS